MTKPIEALPIVAPEPTIQEALLRLHKISSGDIPWADGYKGCMADLRLVVESILTRSKA